MAVAAIPDTVVDELVAEQLLRMRCANGAVATRKIRSGTELVAAPAHAFRMRWVQHDLRVESGPAGTGGHSHSVQYRLIPKIPRAASSMTPETGNTDQAHGAYPS